MRSTCLGSLFLSSIVVSACHLYLDEDGRSGDGRDGRSGCRGRDCHLPDASPLREARCQWDEDCLVGCYCDEGTCKKSDVCNATVPCDKGFACDDRGTCVPRR